MIGTGTLRRGYLIDKKTAFSDPIPGVYGTAGVPGLSYTSGRCQYVFSVRTIASAKFYGIEVGHRGVVTYPAGKLTKVHSKVSLTLG